MSPRIEAVDAVRRFVSVGRSGVRDSILSVPVLSTAAWARLIDVLIGDGELVLVDSR